MRFVILFAVLMPIPIFAVTYTDTVYIGINQQILGQESLSVDYRLDTLILVPPDSPYAWRWVEIPLENTHLDSVVSLHFRPTPKNWGPTSGKGEEIRMDSLCLVNGTDTVVLDDFDKGYAIGGTVDTITNYNWHYIKNQLAYVTLVVIRPLLTSSNYLSFTCQNNTDGRIDVEFYLNLPVKQNWNNYNKLIFKMR
jgi:hypothetical protein